MAETEWSTIEPGSPPEEEKVEFEIEGQETEEVEASEAEVETKAEEQQPEAKVEAEAPQEEATPTIEEEQEKETKGVETSGAQKRIRQLVKQKKNVKLRLKTFWQNRRKCKLSQREKKNTRIS